MADLSREAFNKLVHSAGMAAAKEIRTTLNAVDLLSATEAGYVDAVTAGTVTASKALVVDASRDIATIHDVTMDGNLEYTGATTANILTVPTNLADALSVVDSAGDLIVITTTTGSQSITITPATTITGALTCTAGVQASNVAVTATTDGLTTGLITSGSTFVTVTSDSADKIVTLPTAVIGHIIWLYVGANGCEVRTPASGGATINNVNSDGTNELALTATSSYIFVCVAADTWIARGWTNLGADKAALVPDSA